MSQPCRCNRLRFGTVIFRIWKATSSSGGGGAFKQRHDWNISDRMLSSGMATPCACSSTASSYQALLRSTKSTTMKCSIRRMTA